MIKMRKNVALLGATGAMGQRFVQMLDSHPYFDLRLLISSSRHAGMKYSHVHWLLGDEIPEYVRDMQVESFEPNLFEKEDIDIVFSALPGDVAWDIEGLLRERNYAIFSNASAYRMEEDVPIVIPEVNGEHMRLVHLQKERYGGFIVTNSNCSTSGLVLALAPLQRWKLEEVIVSTYQAISGAGYPGVAAMDINANVVPFIKNEEEKIMRETRKILGTYKQEGIEMHPAKVTASCVRVPVRDGHLESVVVRLDKDFEISDIKKAMREFKGISGLPTAPFRPIIVREEENRPQPVLDAYAGHGRSRGMSISVGRFTKINSYLRFFLLVHNTIRGGAGNAILNAEYAVSNGYI